MADHFVTRQNFMPDTAQQIRKKFLEGVKILKNTPSGKSTKDFDIPALNGVDSPVSRYDLFVIWHHRTMHHLVPPNNTDQRYAAHSGPLFLPWHQIMLLAFEYNLQVALGDAEFALPYWDWAADGSMHLRDSRQARTDHASQRPARTGRVTAETKRRGHRREGHRFRRSQVQRRIDRFSAQPRSEQTQPGPHLGGRRHGTVLVAERSGVLPAPLQRRPDLGRRSPVNSPTCSAGTSYRAFASTLGLRIDDVLPLSPGNIPIRATLDITKVFRYDNFHNTGSKPANPVIGPPSGGIVG